MQDILNSLSTYGYIALFIYSLGGGFFGIVAASTLSYMGKMDMATSMFVAFLSNYIGDMGIFYIARFNKDMIKPYMEKHRRKFALSNLLVKKYGDWVVFIQKFIYGVKTLVPVAMGFSKYSFLKFGLLNIPASAIFVAFFWIYQLSKQRIHHTDSIIYQRKTMDIPFGTYSHRWKHISLF